MLRRYLLCALLVVCWLTRAGEPPLPGLDDVPAVAAEVNGVPIYRSDLVRELVGAAAPAALDRLVRRALVEQAARKMNVAVSAEDIERQLVIDKRDLNEELIRDFPDVKKEFPLAELLYARYRMTLDEYRNLVVRQRLLMRRCVAKDLAPTEEALRAFFRENPDLFQPPVEYHASHILISPRDLRDLHRGFRFRRPLSQMAALNAERQRRINLYRDHSIDLEGKFDERDPAWIRFRQAHPDIQPGAPPTDELEPALQRTRQLAEKILADIRAGVISWDQAVRKHTQDSLDHPRVWKDGKKESPRERAHLPPGDVETFSRQGPLVKEFYEGAKHLKPGEIGGPVRTEYGWHLIKMLEVSAPPQVTLAQCREKVERLYLEHEILGRAEKWLDGLVEQAVLKTERTLLWPPPNDLKAAPPGPDGKAEAGEADLPAGSVNGAVLRRSEVWRELLRSDGDEALTRVIHFEIVLTMLKNMGLDRLEWESSDPARRRPQPPLPQRIAVSAEAVELELNADRLRKDREAPEISFKDYMYLCYGQSVEEYKRKLEAGLVLREAIRRRVPVDEGTLRVQFALARELYSEPAWYELSHILIKPTGGMDKADENARLQARLVADQVYRSCAAKPESFPQLVQDYSMDAAENKARGGALGPCYPEVRSPEFVEAPRLYAELRKQHLQRGQISAPIMTPRGWHIVRVDAVHPEVRAEFEQVKERVERDYLQEQAKMYVDLWLRALTAQAKVKRFLFRSGAPILDEMPPDNFPVPRDK